MGFFKKIHKIEKPLAWHLKNKREMTQIDKLTNENGFFITNPSEIIICQQTGQPERNGQIPRHPHTTKLKLEEIENLNRPITSEEIESVIKNLPTN